ncbi:polycomb protein Pcl [Musca autumnalis]|uniref:polycomb protein Pcl n=1 Tax=Musca autumnalis TaxID=221902 RepID=UPI003CF4BC87
MMNNQFNATNLTGAQAQLPHGQLGQHVAVSPQQNNSHAVLNSFYNAPHHHHHLHQPQQQHHPHHQQAHHHAQQQQLTAAVAAGGLYADPRQLQLTTNPMEKAFYTTSAALGAPQRFYTTASAPGLATSPPTGHPAAQANHPNTILITNNFTHQQPPVQSPEQQRISAALNQGNIRIVTSSNAANPAGAPGGGGYQQAPTQHVFNLNNAKALQHIFPQHLLQQQQQQQQNFHHTSELLAQHFTTSQQHFPAQSGSINTTAPGTPLHMPQYYVANESANLGNAPKILANIATNPMQATNSSVGNANAPGGANGSTVVLDRINICINNLYTDTTSSSSASNSLASTPAQQPSPIIPAIQHKAIIDNAPPPAAAASGNNSNDIYESNALVIDEPDSTTTATTPHTPPTTPENTPPTPSINCSNASKTNANVITTTSNLSSPSTSSSSTLSSGLQQVESQNSHNITTTKQNFANVAQNIEQMAQEESTSASNKTATISSSNVGPTTTHNTPLTPPTPPSPETTPSITNYSSITTPTTAAPTPPPPPPFSNGEDVFIKRQDGRFYLGTVIDTARNQFLVRFDDKTEQWCNAEEMRKLGGGGGSGNSGNDSNTNSNATAKDQPMCVSCKQQQPDSQVEICERCGRGYHRKCTMETSKNSGVWLCKRCDKPMKLGTQTEDEDEVDSEMEGLEVEDVCRQLPYDLNSLTWDSKHRVNEQQIYCYCGKSGKFDHNMLQCCRCLNWYHIECSQKFKGNLLRGDVFFVFCCTVCNNGEEYLRRLQIDWVDLLHLIIYNLSTMKKHQNHKYHHLLKDIYPFALEKRKMLPMPKQWKTMAENDFLEKIKTTLKDNPERFVGGKEIKRDHYFFALRTNGPPFVKPINLAKDQLLNDDFILNGLKLKLLPEAPENVDVQFAKSVVATDSLQQTPTSKPKSSEDKVPRDIYAFDDTSDDEVPIKIILDKAKKKNKSTEHLAEEPMEEDEQDGCMVKTSTSLEKLDVEDDNANDAIPTKTEQIATTPTTSTSLSSSSPTKKEQKHASSETHSMDNDKLTKSTTTTATNTTTEKSSRKRKAFSLTKSYEKQRLIDSSSDENSSSSSRCTSLDLIIPPPKNFLGQNNPFRMITPKKKSPAGQAGSTAGGSGGKKSVKFGLVNGLDFSSKLAVLKNSGLFPKLNSKAAGQPRTVRTIKRRLSAKDITIGPNQEVRRRRIRRLSANVEVISTTTINPIPTNYFPIHAKDLLAAAAASTTTAASLFNNQTTPTTTTAKTSLTTSIAGNTLTGNSSNTSPTTSSTAKNTEGGAGTSTKDTELKPSVPAHGRRLRQRPPKSSPNTSRRNSVSSNQSSTSSSIASTSSLSAASHSLSSQHPQLQNAQQSHEDLKQTVNKYFGIVNRIESGEQFSIRAKRRLPNGQMQYLIEWGSEQQQQQQTPPIATLSQEETKSQNEKDSATTTADKENTMEIVSLSPTTDEMKTASE